MPPTSQSGDPVLQVRQLSIRFNGVAALTSVDLDLFDGEICGLIGPNGAGKTTLFNCITRLVDPQQGVISVDGRRIDGVSRHKVIRLGVARTFQNLGVYAGMTVRENVLLGAHHRSRQYSVPQVVKPWSSADDERRLSAICEPILATLGLSSVQSRRAGSLSYPILKRLEIARALASGPRVLLLDEPAAGLTHGEVVAFGDLIRSVQSTFGVAVLLVEHHMELVMSLCSRVVVLHLGRNLAEGSPGQVRSDPLVREAYLGSTACQS